MQSPSYSRYRFNFLEQSLQEDDGQIVCGGAVAGVEYRQADLGKRPLRDHQVYAQVEYDPASVGGQIVEALGEDAKDEAATIKTPIYGNFATVKDDLYLRLTVEGVDIFRFRLEDAGAVEVVAKPGEVKAGDTVARFSAACSYLAAEPWASKPNSTSTRPVIDRIAGDLLSATRNEPQLYFAAEALMRMLEADKSHVEYVSEAACRPIPLVQLSNEVLEQKRELGWEPNVEFKRALLRGVSPDAVGTDDMFAVTSPCVGRITAVVRHESYKIVHIEDEESVEHTLVLPICAEVKDDLDRVFQDQVIGNYVPRCYYESYDQLIDVADGCIVKIEDEFLWHRAIWPGDTNWNGNGVLLDQRLAGCLTDHARAFKLDMYPILPYVDKKYGIAVLPATPFDLSSQGFARQVNGVRYDTTPVGNRFAGVAERSSAYVEDVRTSRRRPRRRRVKVN